MQQFTSKEFGEMVGAVETSVYGVLSFLEAKGAIKRVGERKRPDGKGKPSVLYEAVPDASELIVAAFKPMMR